MAAARPADICRAFGVRPDRIRLLQRRHRAHWLVSAGEARFVLRRFGTESGLETREAVAWELETASRIAAAGWPAPLPLAPLLERDGATWALLPFLGGRHLGHGNIDDAGYRRLGRLLATLHADLARLGTPPQRPGWISIIDAVSPAGGEARRDLLLARLARADAGLGALLAAAAARLQARDLPAVFAAAPRMIVHGDLAPWNVRLRGGRVAALLDFEMTHVDVAAADLAYSRRGFHDGVVDGYLEVADLPPEHQGALDALWIGSLFFGVWRSLEDAEQSGRPVDPADFAWQVQQLAKTRPYRRAS